MRTCWPFLMVICSVLLTGVVHAVPSATQPSRPAAERAEKLKANIKTFTLRLGHSGEEDKPYYRLLLSVPTIRVSATPSPFIQQVQIAEEQAKKIIDYLATEGFMDEALDGPIAAAPAEPRGPNYTLSVQVENKDVPVVYWERLGWDMKMLHRLDGLRTVLDGDAAESMDLLLGRLAGHRREWEKAAAKQPVSSKPAVKNGLQVIVTLPKATIAVDEPLKFTVQFKNASRSPFLLYDADYFWHWRVTFEDQRKIGQWRLLKLFKDQRIRPEVKTLKPGESLDVPVNFDPKEHSFEFAWEGLQRKEVQPVKSLPLGKYELAIEMVLDTCPTAGTWEFPFWTGQIKTNPVELEITGNPDRKEH